jgi:DNA polymerase-3 subunit delta'
MAHAYVLKENAQQQNAMALAIRTAQLLFCKEDHAPCGKCDHCRRIAARQHVDVLWIEPKSKSRQILVEDVDSLISRMQQTAYGGEWKVGIISDADRLNVAAANKLLKTLEEPPKQSMLLLLTSSPDSLLPTILSRCQFIRCDEVGGDEAEHHQVEKWMEQFPPRQSHEAVYLADLYLKHLQDKISDSVDDVDGDEADKGAWEARQVQEKHRQQQKLLLQLNHWIRDLLLLSYNVNDSSLTFPMHKELLVEKSKQASIHQWLAMLADVERMHRCLNMNLLEYQVVEDIFRSMASHFSSSCSSALRPST